MLLVLHNTEVLTEKKEIDFLTAIYFTFLFWAGMKYITKALLRESCQLLTSRIKANIFC